MGILERDSGVRIYRTWDQLAELIRNTEIGWKCMVVPFISPNTREECCLSFSDRGA